MHLLPFNKLGSGYIEHQWFLNYSSGFIRRGLFGELAKWAHLDLHDLYFFFRCLITISFTVFFGIVLHSFGRIDTKSFLYFFIVVTSPIFYSAYAKLNGRFDLIFSLAITVLFLLKNSKFSNFLLAVSIIPLGLIHELWLILYVPLYIILTVKNKLKLQECFILCFNFLVLLILWWFTLIPLKDVSVVCGEISHKLHELSYTCISNIHISFSTQSIHDAINGTVLNENLLTFSSVIKRLLEYFATIIYILFASAPLWFVLHRGKLLVSLNKIKFLSLISLYIAISLLAQDWGRFLVDLIQIFFIYKISRAKLKFETQLNTTYFVIFIMVNIIFIKLVFTKIPIY